MAAISFLTASLADLLGRYLVEGPDQVEAPIYLFLDLSACRAAFAVSVRIRTGPDVLALGPEPGQRRFVFRGLKFGRGRWVM